MEISCIIIIKKKQPSSLTYISCARWIYISIRTGLLWSTETLVNIKSAEQINSNTRWGVFTSVHLLHRWSCWCLLGHSAQETGWQLERRTWRESKWMRQNSTGIRRGGGGIKKNNKRTLVWLLCLKPKRAQSHADVESNNAPRWP